MTVVQPRPLCIRATAPENLLADLRQGLKGTAVPTGYPDMKLPATIDRVGDVPVSPGNFDAKLRVELKGKTKGLAPGMTCKVKFTAYLKKDAICVPPSTLIADELDEQKQSVKVLEKDGKTTSRPVTIGKKTDKQVEILGGLSEGEQIVLEPSKDQK
jgi:multidrug efflux pump subunit AcrA (membrane-fusion protein)